MILRRLRLHLAALAHQESPIDWKPSVCWQLPIKVDWEMRDDDVEIASIEHVSGLALLRPGSTTFGL